MAQRVLNLGLDGGRWFLYTPTSLISGKLRHCQLKRRLCVCVWGGGQSLSRPVMTNLFERVCPNCKFQWNFFAFPWDFENKNKVLEFYPVIITNCIIIIISIINAYYNWCIVWLLCGAFHNVLRRHGSLQQWRISMQPCWRVCGKNLNIVSMCAVSPVVHTSNCRVTRGAHIEHL
jgi:hypothetical protein